TLALWSEEYEQVLPEHQSMGNKAARAQKLGYLRVMNLENSIQRASKSYIAPRPEVMISESCTQGSHIEGPLNG
ncbi:hypothetical protein FRC11_013909, partial [Ceratobasidium sp. 423]